MPAPVIDDLFGREGSLQALAGYLTTVADPGGPLLLTGDAGIGKTALLRTAEARAAQARLRVIGAQGSEFHIATSFAALRQLLAPLRVHLPLVSPTHREVLLTVLSEGTRAGAGPPPALGAVGSAVLALLRVAAATEGPLLLVADDAQWLDPASGDVLAFVARRLIGTHTGLLAVTRPGFGGALEEADLPQHHLAPLSEDHARALLRERFPRLTESVRERVLLEAEGNPLALLELPHVLDISLPRESPARERSATDVVRLFGPRVRALPGRTRELLLMAALEGSGDLDVAHRLGGEDILSVVMPAEHGGLVRVEDNARRLAFRHPLVSTTLVELATPDERQRAHARIAEALTDSPERYAWHLAAASRGPDEAVALLLERQSRICLGYGDVTGAARLLQRAAELSPTPQARARRQVQGAFLGADVTGDLNGAAQLLADADQVEHALTQSLPATVAATYLLLNAECEVDTAHRLLSEAVRAYSGGSDGQDPMLAEGLHSLLMMSWFSGRRAMWAPFLQAVERLDQGAPPLVTLVHHAFGDPVHRGRDALPALADVLRHVNEERDPLRITRIGLACVYTDRMAECRPALARVVDSGRSGGAVALAINALVSSCVDDWLTGQWDEAITLCAEGMALSQRHGYRRYSVILGGYIDQLVRVARGDLDGGLEAAQEMGEWAAERGAGMSRHFADHLRTLRAVALGDFEAAYRHASTISPAGELAPYNPHALWVLFDLVESAMRTDRQAEAVAHVTAMREKRIDELSPRLRMLVDGCTALTRAGEEAASLYDSALSRAEGARWPFDRARITLAYGEHLHRSKDSAARTVLEEAATTFHRLGATPWESRAAAVLRASGTTLRARPGTAPRDVRAVLTARELQIATLAAHGLSNRQIGEQLFLSPRSVGAALYRMFPKLGVTSRGALAAALAAGDEQTMGRASPGSPDGHDAPPGRGQ